MDLLNYLNNKFVEGIIYTDAIQLCLAFYCSLEFVPDNVDETNLSKENIAYCFKQLAKNNKIIGFEQEDAKYYGVDDCDICSQEHWEGIIYSIFKKARSYDKHRVVNILK